jgi:ABC-type sugar transport system substrate-binding protein
VAHVDRWAGRLVVVLGLTCMLLATQSCRSGSQPLRIAVIEPTGGLQYWQAFNRRLKAEHPEIRFQFLAPESLNDSPSQARMIGNAIHDKVDGILLSPSHQLVPVSVVKRALAEKIPVVVMGGPLEISPNERLSFVGWSNEQMGDMAAERLMAHLHHQGRVAVISSSPTLHGTVVRENAFLSRVSLEPHMESSGVYYALSDWARARQAAIDASSGPKKVDGIFAIDDFCTHGVIVAFENRQKDRPVIVGAAEESDQLEALQKGEVDALIVSDPSALATASISTLLQLIRAPKVIATQSIPLYAVDRNWRRESNVAFLSSMLDQSLP